MPDRYAVIGNPIAHSKSPTIQAAFAASTGQDMSYERLLAPLDGFRATVERFAAEGGLGLNVTIPTKGGARSERDFDLLAQYPGQATYAATLVFSDERCRTRYETGTAAPTEERIAALCQRFLNWLH